MSYLPMFALLQNFIYISELRQNPEVSYSPAVEMRVTALPTTVEYV